MESKVNIRNKKASFNFEFVEKYVAGIVLTGTEIKSIREGKASLVDAFCYFNNNELWVKGMNISEYWWGNYNNHDPRRDRKLLLTKKELQKLQRKTQEKGLTIVAIHLFINERGLAKLEIALARGKKEYDKREDLKNEDARRELSQVKKAFAHKNY
ncbi:MAG: SsrA-binding protein SmpB [Bacteroidota bacterium]|nr:SsrA-binding protein SmpB [Bacteroidota bacterium]